MNDFLSSVSFVALGVLTIPGHAAEPSNLHSCLLITNDSDFVRVRRREFASQAVGVTRPDTEYGAICTLNVIGGNTLLGAGHCFDATVKGDLSVRCPGQAAFPVSRQDITVKSANNSQLEGDLAIVRTNTSFNSERALRLVTSAREIEDLLGLNDCHYSGYPGSSFGQLVSVRVDTTKVKPAFLRSTDLVSAFGQAEIQVMMEAASRRLQRPGLSLPPPPTREELVNRLLPSRSTPSEQDDLLSLSGGYQSEGGFSGSALYCVKNNVRYAIGVLSTGTSNREGGRVWFESTLHHRDWIFRTSSARRNDAAAPTNPGTEPQTVR